MFKILRFSYLDAVYLSTEMYLSKVIQKIRELSVNTSGSGIDYAKGPNCCEIARGVT